MKKLYKVLTALSVFFVPFFAQAQISGSSSVCVGSNIFLNDPNAPETGWLSGNSSIATVDNFGNVTGVSAGVVVISYGAWSFTGDVWDTMSVTVNTTPDPGTIWTTSGFYQACPGAFQELNESVPGGVWSSGDITVVTIDTTGGAFAIGGDHPATTNIYYTVSNSCGSASASVGFTALPSARAGFISASPTLCAGATSTAILQGMADPGGVWSSDNTSIATVFSTGLEDASINGLSAGTTNISYTVTTVCNTSKTWVTVTVEPQPDPITTGATFVCVQSTMNLYDDSTGGVWTSGNTGIANINSGTGVVTGVSAGTAPITYTLPGGCYATTSVLVDPLPDAGNITGTLTISRGGETTLVNIGANGPGTWNSCNSYIATIDASTGLVVGVAIGNTAISYSVTNICGTAYTYAAMTVGDCSTASTISTFAGSHVNGVSGDGAAATAAQMGSAFGIAADGAGNVYVSDYNFSVIRKIDPSGIITTICGIAGNPGYNGDNIPASAAQLNGPEGLTLDGNNNLYIADKFNERIRKINLNTGIITTIAGAGHHGGWQGYDYGNGVLATDANLDFPTGVAVDCGGNIYIADWGSQTVRKITPDGIINKFAGTYAGGYNGDDIQANSAQLNSPSGVAVDCAGNVYIADSWNNRVRKVSPDGIIITIGGDGTPTYGGDGRPGGSAQLWIPNSITLDACGNVYVCDWQNNVVRLLTYMPFAGNNYYMSTFAGKNANDWHGYDGDGGDKDSAYMYLPSALAIDGLGNIYIADWGNYVVREISNTLPSSRSFARGTTQDINVCENAKSVDISSQLAIPDVTSGMAETWSVSVAPLHGTLNGFNASATSREGVTTPSNVTYTPEPGYTGWDAFTVVMNDGTTAASTTVNVKISKAPNAGTITGAASVKDNNTVTLTNVNGDANGIWSSSNNLIATVDAAGNVTGIGNGLVSISYTVTNSCGSSTATTGIVIAGEVINQSKAVLFPNPNNGTFQCEFNSESDCQLELSVADVSGRIIYKQAVNATTGINSITVTLPNDVPKPSMLTVTLGNKHVKYPTSKITITE